MLKADAPLLVNPKPGWHKLSWFSEFIASMAHYRDNISTARMAVAAREHMFAWESRKHRFQSGAARHFAHLPQPARF